MDELTAWSRDLTVEVGGHGVVSHTGSAALRMLADRTGLTGALSKALRRRGFTPVHDRGRVLADTAVLIADGGRVMSDLAILRDQHELFGPVASDPTLWRALEEIGPDQRNRVAAARARTRRHVWGLIEARHGRIPPSRVADRESGGDDRDPHGRHDPDRAQRQTAGRGHVQGQLGSPFADRVV